MRCSEYVTTVSGFRFDTKQALSVCTSRSVTTLPFLLLLSFEPSARTFLRARPAGRRPPCLPLSYLPLAREVSTLPPRVVIGVVRRHRLRRSRGDKVPAHPASPGVIRFCYDCSRTGRPRRLGSSGPDAQTPGPGFTISAGVILIAAGWVMNVPGAACAWWL